MDDKEAAKILTQIYFDEWASKHLPSDEIRDAIERVVVTGETLFINKKDFSISFL